MTSTPVKDVGSLLNYVGKQGAAASGTKSGSSESFGSVMNKTSYGGENAAGKNQVKSAAAADNRMNKVHPKKDELTAGKEDRAVTTDDVSVTEEERQAVQEAGNDMIRKIAEELGVSEEEIVDAMEELGFGITDLLNAGSLTKLVLTLSGEDNSLTLLTNEELYGNVQNLLQSLEGIRQELMEEFSVNQEQLDMMLKLTDESAAEVTGEELQENVAETLPEIPAHSKTQKITVTVEEGAQAVSENSNAPKVQDTMTKDGSAEEKSSDNRQNAKSEQNYENANPVQNVLLENRPQNVEAVFDRMAEAGTSQTQEIMDQILDYLKIQLKPEMDQLEMQLHPANLGTLRIQLVSKGGEVTAQFQVQNEAVKAAIENQLTVLKDTLREQGVRVEAVEVTVESHGFESNLWQGQERENGSSYRENKKAQRRINLNALDDDFESEASKEELLSAEMMKANGGTVDFTA